jgi:hypothetical protein
MPGHNRKALVCAGGFGSKHKFSQEQSAAQ